MTKGTRAKTSKIAVTPAGGKNSPEDGNRAEKAWAEFLDRLVHDLREPLRTINAFSELLQEIANDRLGAEGQEVVSEILSGTIRIRGLIDGVSAYSSALRTSGSPGSDGASLQSAFNVTLATLGDLIDAEGATVSGIAVTGMEALEDDPKPRVAVSLERLMQLFENVIGNSLRFRSDAPPVITVAAGQQQPGQWTIQIMDNGIGIDPADCEAVFKPFMRVQGRQYGGAGLGLSVCRKIVETHGGSIQIAPRPQGGAVCTFTLPAA
jgi:two-component system, chemotaxis family, sensor kinase Cph1